MSILIGHASIDEKNKLKGGIAGDQTGKEVCTRTWYSKPWDYMAVHPDANVREKHAAAVEQACANVNIGYDQNQRNTLNTQAKMVGYELSKIATACETDCSALQNVCAVASGAPGVTYGSNGWTTSTMKAALQKAGYKIITDNAYLKSSSYCVRGAIYVKSGSHTVCGLTNGANYKKTLKKAGIIESTASVNSTSSKMEDYNMKTIKRGSKGNAVKVWQIIVGVTADGIFGSGTETATKTWQKKHGLTVDGIVGPKSWKAGLESL